MQALAVLLLFMLAISVEQFIFDQHGRYANEQSIQHTDRSDRN